MLAGSKGGEPDNDVEVPQLNVSFIFIKLISNYITRSLTNHKQSIQNSPVPFVNCCMLKFNVPMSIHKWVYFNVDHYFNFDKFITDVMKPLNMEALMDLEVQNLSGGELQRVAIALALGKPADVYLIDEPSAYLDSEQRLHAAKVIKR